MKTPPGLVITYNPAPEFFQNLGILCKQLDRVIVVDNGSMPDIHSLLEREALEQNTSLVVLFNNSNLGVAAALNQGFRWAIEQGYKQIIAFDQDSLPAVGMVQELMEVYETHPDRENIAIVVPRVENPAAGIDTRFLKARGRYFFERASCTGNRIDDVSIVITSGSLNDLSVYKKIGPFWDDLFVDYVDTEYCLRALDRGYKIAVACKARLQHRLGNQQMNQFGPLTLRPTHHSPIRWYYISRNRVYVWRNYSFKFPHWALYDLIVANYALLKMLLLEEQKGSKILALFLGTYDGIRHRTGPIPVSRLALISNERSKR